MLVLFGAVAPASAVGCALPASATASTPESEPGLTAAASTSPLLVGSPPQPIAPIRRSSAGSWRHDLLGPFPAQVLSKFMFSPRTAFAAASVFRCGGKRRCPCPNVLHAEGSSVWPRTPSGNDFFDQARDYVHQEMSFTPVATGLARDRFQRHGRGEDPLEAGEERLGSRRVRRPTLTSKSPRVARRTSRSRSCSKTRASCVPAHAPNGILDPMDPSDLLREVLARPDDDEPRLVYADWLQDQGDPRGEFIQVQCSFAGTAPGDDRLWRMGAREATLLRSHFAQWLPSGANPASPAARHFSFSRGFLSAGRRRRPGSSCPGTTPSSRRSPARSAGRSRDR